MSCTMYKKQSYLNNTPPTNPHLVILSKASHMAVLFSFYGQKKKKERGSQHPKQDCTAT